MMPSFRSTIRPPSPQSPSCWLSSTSVKYAILVLIRYLGPVCVFGKEEATHKLLRRPTSDTPYSRCCASTMPESQAGMSRGSARKCHGLGDWRISGSGVEREDCGVRGQGALPAVASFNISIALFSPLTIREKRRKETKFMSRATHRAVAARYSRLMSAVADQNSIQREKVVGQVSHWSMMEHAFS